MIQRPDTSVHPSYKYGLLLHETAPPPQRGSSSPRSVRAPCSLSHAMTATKPVPRSRPSCAPSRIRRSPFLRFSLDAFYFTFSRGSEATDSDDFDDYD